MLRRQRDWQWVGGAAFAYFTFISLSVLAGFRCKSFPVQGFLGDMVGKPDLPTYPWLWNAISPHLFIVLLVN
jgi:hypothetical protein